MNDLFIIPFEVQGMRDVYSLAFRYVHSHSYTFFTNNFSGALLKKINKLARSFEAFADIVLFNILFLLFDVVLMISILAMQSIMIAIIFLVFVI